MVVRAGEAEAAPALRTLNGPHDVFRFAFVLLHFGVAPMSLVGPWPAARAVRWNSGENRRHVLHVLRETHVIIPLVVDFEGLHSARDGMVGKGGKIRVPMRVDR